MHFVLTTAGEAAIAANPGVPPKLYLFRLGDAYGYTPDPSDTALHGMQVHSGSPSDPVVQSSTLIKYTLAMDKDLGDFAFGEVGLYLPGGVLFALGASTIPIEKLKDQGTQEGNNLVIDCYVTTVGSNYAIFAELGNSAWNLNVAASNSVDALPSAFRANPNVYVVPSPDGAGSLLAYSNNAAWSLTGYEEIADVQAVASATANTVTVGQPSTGPVFNGELLLQVMDGPATGAIRIVAGYSSAGQVFTVSTPFLTIPNPNDTIRILKKTQLRDHVAEILAGLSDDLTAGHLNDLVNHPLSGMVKRNGTTPMWAPFDAGGFRAINLGNPVLPQDAVTKDYVDTQMGGNADILAQILQQVNTIQNLYLRKDGAVPMTGHLNMGANRIINMAAPINPSDGATKGYADGAIAAAVAAIPTVHNDLQGLQGGDGVSQFYHLTSAEKSLVGQLSSQGFPIASYTERGVTRYATEAEVGMGTLSQAAVTPESLTIALQQTPSNLTNAIISLVTSNTSAIQFGASDPSVVTPTTPNLYADVSNTTPVLWTYHAGAWKKVTGHIFRTGAGAPTGLTPIQPPLYIDTSANPPRLYVYYAGSWKQQYTPYVQYGIGAPTLSTPVEPTLYVDRSTTPWTLYSRYGGAWSQVSASLDGSTAAEFYFNCQFGR